jgi:hypothetical protein
MSTFNELKVTLIDGTPRVLDTDLGEWLGYKNPRESVRRLVRKHMKALEGHGTVCQQSTPYISGGGASQLATKFYLNRHQAIHITLKSTTANAEAMTHHVVEVFVGYLEGDLKAKTTEIEEGFNQKWNTMMLKFGHQEQREIELVGQANNNTFNYLESQAPLQQDPVQNL